MEGQQERAAEFDRPPLSPLQALAERLRKVLPDSRRAHAEEEEEEEGDFVPRHRKQVDTEESFEAKNSQQVETVEEQDIDGQVKTEEVVEEKETSQQAEIEEVEQPAQTEADKEAAEEPLTQVVKTEESKESSHHDHDDDHDKEDDHQHHGGHGKDDEPGHHHGHDHDKKDSTADEEEEEAKIDQSLASKLIPELAPEPEEQQKTESKAPEAPAGPVTLKDLAKKFGTAFGSTPNPVGNVFGRIDPEALADAGLPPVNNIGGLMGALVQKQIGGLSRTFDSIK